jgi:hypothetical protein
LFGRAPDGRELASALRFLTERPGAETLQEYAQTLLSSNEFIFVD